MTNIVAVNREQFQQKLAARRTSCSFFARRMSLKNCESLRDDVRATTLRGKCIVKIFGLDTWDDDFRLEFHFTEEADAVAFSLKWL